MKTDLTLNSALDIERELRTWRTRALNALLTVTAIAAAPVIGTVVFEAVRHPQQSLCANMSETTLLWKLV